MCVCCNFLCLQGFVVITLYNAQLGAPAARSMRVIELPSNTDRALTTEQQHLLQQSHSQFAHQVAKRLPNH